MLTFPGVQASDDTAVEEVASSRAEATAPLRAAAAASPVLAFLAPADAALRIAPPLPPSAVPPTLVGRRRWPSPGERRVQILEALAGLLDRPGVERVTTAALAARLSVSEAALYRHFASKAQMVEGLVEWFEAALFAAIDAAVGDAANPTARARATVVAWLGFAERRPGLARVLAGDGLLHESAGLAERADACVGRLEARLRAELAPGPHEAELRASVLVAFGIGRLQRFVRSGCVRPPTEGLEPALRLLVP